MKLQFWRPLWPSSHRKKVETFQKYNKHENTKCGVGCVFCSSLWPSASLQKDVTQEEGQRRKHQKASRKLGGRGLKINGKLIRNRCSNPSLYLCPFGVHFSWILERFGGAKSKGNGRKSDHETRAENRGTKGPSIWHSAIYGPIDRPWDRGSGVP